MSSTAWRTTIPGADTARELMPAFFSHLSYGALLQRLLARLLLSLTRSLPLGNS